MGPWVQNLCYLAVSNSLSTYLDPRMNRWMMQNILGKLAILLCYGKLILYDIRFGYISKECMSRLCQARRFMKASLQAAEMAWTARNCLHACRVAEWFETVGTNAWQALESRAKADGLFLWGLGGYSLESAGPMQVQLSFQHPSALESWWSRPRLGSE